jgi:hypothetical protein
MDLAGRLALALLLLVTACRCRMPSPESPAGRLIQCSTEAVAQNWHKALPGVNTCLGRDDAPPAIDTCLLGLIAPAVGVTEDVLACVLRRQGERFAASASTNPDDQFSARAAGNAQGFMARRGYRFADDGGTDRSQ